MNSLRKQSIQTAFEWITLGALLGGGIFGLAQRYHHQASEPATPTLDMRQSLDLFIIEEGRPDYEVRMQTLPQRAAQFTATGDYRQPACAKALDELITLGRQHQIIVDFDAAQRDVSRWTRPLRSTQAEQSDENTLKLYGRALRPCGDHITTYLNERGLTRAP